MKNNNNLPQLGLPAEACEACGFTTEDALELHAGNNALIILKSRMTVLEVAYAIETLSDIASDLTVALAKAGGICNNCGQRDAAPNSRTQFSSNSKHDARVEAPADFSPAECVANCSLCQNALEGDGIILPDYLLEEADIPKDAKLEAYVDEDSGEITIVESDVQQDITDLPDGILEALLASGVCLAELDELIMLEEIVYGK